MALQTSSPQLTGAIAGDQYQTDSTRRQYSTTPQQSTANPSQPPSGGTIRTSTQASPHTQNYGRQRSDDTRRHERSHSQTQAPSVQPPPRTSSNQQRSVALATDAQLADRTRPRESAATAQESSSRTNSGAPASHLRPDDNAASPSRPDVSRGNSEVITRVVVDDPKSDIQREQARIAESVPESQARSHTNRAVSMPPVSVSSTSDSVKPAKRQDFSNTASKRKEARLGDYILGQTLGEGEFGKVRLGWKKDGSVQVAVKLIRRENLSHNPSRLPKIYREISILGQLSHPNIVKLHEMVETERYIGIILEYASGGELFDYILTHRYLKDNAARRLFAQLVSGVGYLHKKGIVHRDLKLENLLLDRNRNLMISDFGFANTFDPRDELGDEIENRITDKEFVKRRDLEKVQRNGFRRGDLMQTSCGSPCYAAPELVVSDSLYTGRKVDVWSCGVILYAMLAGYLPFDDDPANPEGDNINLLYKYICNTPLTFPEYVTPHARDLLRRILVPDPRKRADLFEVARHSWLSEYSHVVEHITSTTTTIDDVASAAPLSNVKPTNPPRTQENLLIPPIDGLQAPYLARSASVREPSKPSSQGNASQYNRVDTHSDKTSSPRDKRRTVQLEYVPPRTQTVRGEASPISAQESIGIPSTIPGAKISGSGYEKPLPQDPPVARHVAASTGREDATRPGRNAQRATTDTGGAFVQSPTRPTTGQSLSSNSMGRLPSRGNSYSQPLAPTVAATSASGRIQQPTGRQYISGPVPQPEPYISESAPRPISQRLPSVRKSRQPGQGSDAKGHKRSTTLGNIFGRNSIFGGSKTQQASENQRSDRRYPPVSMKGPLPTDSPRASTDSRGRNSFHLNRKASGSDTSNKPEKSRRFSLIPGSFTFKGLGSSGHKEGNFNESKHFERQPQRGATSAGHPNESMESMNYGSAYQNPPRSAPQRPYPNDAYGATSYTDHPSPPIPVHRARQSSQMQHGASGFVYGTSGPAEAQLSTSHPAASQAAQSVAVPQMAHSYDQGGHGAMIDRYPSGFTSDGMEPSGSRAGKLLQKNNRRFADGYEDSGHGGSSGAARKVMDFFRRRGRARAGEA